MKKIRGTCASVGLVIANVFEFKENNLAGTILDATKETKRLHDSLEKAISQIEKLTSTANTEAKKILEFQIELAKDPSLTEDMWGLIDKGYGAVKSWQDSMNEQIKEFDEETDEYFQARSADLSDLRDRVLRILTNKKEVKLPKNCIYVANNITPSFFLANNWENSGIVLFAGSKNSHVAILARANKVPMLVGVGKIKDIKNKKCILDSNNETFIIDPDAIALTIYNKDIKSRVKEVKLNEKYLSQAAITKDKEKVNVLINIASVNELANYNVEHIDGIGLARTELLYADGLVNEATQLNQYKEILQWAKNKPVTIRTLDAGGDKPIAKYTINNETNPFLGMRGIRLSLNNLKVFRQQIRALLKASKFGNLKIMLPMITINQEYQDAKKLIIQEAIKLNINKVPPIGIMVEVPNVAIDIKKFNADFYSIGSNDLIQYVFAVGRDVENLDYLVNNSLDSIYELITRVVNHGKKTNKEVSICGDLASQASNISKLLDTGIRNLSMNYQSIASVKKEIINYSNKANLK